MNDSTKAALKKCVDRLTAAVHYEGGTLLSANKVAEILNVHPDAIPNMLISRDLFAMVGQPNQHLGRDPGVPSWLIHEGKPLPGIAMVMERLAILENDHHLRAVCFFSEKNELLRGKTPVEVLRDGNVAAVVFAAGEWDVSVKHSEND